MVKSSNSKVYYESVVNPTLVDFEYSYEALSQVLTFDRPKSLYLQLFSSILENAPYWSNASTLFKLVGDFYGGESESIDEDYTICSSTPSLIKQKKRVCYVATRSFTDRITDALKLVSYCLRLGISHLSLITDGNDDSFIEISFIQIALLLLKTHHKLDKIQYKINAVDYRTAWRTTVSNCVDENDEDLVSVLEITCNKVDENTEVFVLDTAGGHISSSQPFQEYDVPIKHIKTLTLEELQAVL